MRISRIAVVAVVAAACMAGCHKGPVTHTKDLGTASLGAVKLAESQDHRVAIAIYQGWGKGMAGQMNPMDFIGTIGGEASPAALRLAEEQRDKEYEEEIAAAEKKDGIIISIVDQQTRQVVGEERNRYTVRRFTKGPGLTLDEAAEVAKADIAGAGQAKKVTLPIGPAVRYDSSVEQRDGGVISKIMYVIVDGADFYEVTFTTEAAAQTIDSMAPGIMETLRIKPSKDA